jgi:predicted ester cyclase
MEYILGTVTVEEATMSDNKQVVRSMLTDIINDGKLELVDQLFDPEFTSETPQGTLDRNGFKEYVATWRGGFPDIHCEVDDLIEEGDQVAWSVRATGTHTGDFMEIPPTGRIVDFDSLNIGRFRDGRGYQHKVLMNDVKMMTQLGVMPEPPAT